MSIWLSDRDRQSVAPRPLAIDRRVDHLLVPLLGVLLLVRVLTDNLSSPDSRHSGSLNLSAGIAVLFVLIAAALLLRRRRGLLPTALAALWLGVWTAIAMGTRGASTETLREGVREGSVIALGVVVFNAREVVTVPIAARLLQFAGFASALIALYQLTTHTGMDVAGHIRSNGTFAHPNSAAMFFAIAVTGSLWLYLDHGRRRLDALLALIFAAAVVATSSIDGLITIVVMLVALGALRRPSPDHSRILPYILAGLVVLSFFVTPLGSQRISSESSTNLSAAEGGEANTTLAWRLHKWKTLLPEWERAPVFGRGLGTTTTTEGRYLNEYTGALPHNEYLRYLVETGIVGLAILLCALAMLILTLLRKRSGSAARDPDVHSSATLAVVVIIGCLVDSLADNTLLNSPTCYAAALIIAAALAVSGIQQEPAPTPQPA